MPLEFDEDQERILAHERGALLVTGPAGTGKTAALRERFARLIESGADAERVTIVVRSKAERRLTRDWLLHERLHASLPTLHVHTVHSLAFQVVSARFDALGYEQPPAVLSAVDQFARVQELLSGEDPALWPAYGSMLELRGFADEVRQFLLRAQEALLKPEDIEKKAEKAGLGGWPELAAFYRRYLQVLDDSAEVDFAGLVEQAAAAAGNGDPPFDHLIVDDYQDATFATEALLVALRAQTLVVAGDPGAHVFSFQGYTDVPLRRFVETVPGAEQVELSEQHRADGLELRAWFAPHTSEEHAAVARELRRLHVEENVPWNELAVVVRRQGTDLGGLLRALDDTRVPRAIPEGGLSLTAEAATLPYVLALKWLGQPAERDGLIESLLTSELARISPAAARGLARAATAGGRPPAEALRQTHGLTEAEAASVRALRETLEEAEGPAARSVPDTFSILWRKLEYSARLVEAADSRRDLDAVLAFAHTVERASESGDASVASFLDALAAGEHGPGVSGGDAIGEDAVHVLTAHATAGLEFDTIVVAGTMEGNFPSLTRPEPMFDIAALEHPISQSERNARRLADERRLFDLVAGRARRRVLFTASDTFGEESHLSAHSRFVDERSVAWTRAPGGPFADPLSVGEAAASWRRTLAGHGASPAERLAALDGLLALGADPAGWWFQRDWTDTGRPLHDAIRVSYSRLDKLENCELQYALGQELGLGRLAGYHAWVGKLVHKLIEDCEAGKIERSLDALVAEAERRWDANSFPSTAVSEEYRRLVTRRMLPHWIEHYGDTPALGQEVAFAFEYDGATINGYIDRIGPILSAGNRITDYKTGKPDNAPKPDDNLQLGVYWLAVEEAEELAEYRPVRAVELAFLKGNWKGQFVAPKWQPSGKGKDGWVDSMRERVSERIAQLRELNQTEIYEPNPGADCHWCDFKSLCPLWVEGAPIFAGRSSR